uniref:Uncharacterized protein n=1 Tax=Strigamia maritima TaxID=126957 RepID=T1JDU2_STRMM
MNRVLRPNSTLAKLRSKLWSGGMEKSVGNSFNPAPEQFTRKRCFALFSKHFHLFGQLTTSHTRPSTFKSSTLTSLPVMESWHGTARIPLCSSITKPEFEDLPIDVAAKLLLLHFAQFCSALNLLRTSTRTMTSLFV